VRIKAHLLGRQQRMSSYYMPCNYCGYVGEEGGGERDINGVSLGRYRLKGGKSWAGEDMSGSPLQ